MGKVENCQIGIFASSARGERATQVDFRLFLRRPRPGDWVAVSVTDTRPGIPPDKREAIFQQYMRLNPKAQKGVGIGLAISRRIARLLGDGLAMENEVSAAPHSRYGFRRLLREVILSRKPAAAAVHIRVELVERPIPLAQRPSNISVTRVTVVAGRCEIEPVANVCPTVLRRIGF